MATNYPINPRVRAFGKARIDIASRAKNQTEWEKLWKHPENSFPFIWSKAWKQYVEHRVDDFPAEVGFFIDILGLPINSLDPGYAMFTSPQGDFFFSVVPTLILVGEYDEIATFEVAGKLEKEISATRKVVFPSIAHMIPLEQPALFNKVTLDFLNEKV